MARVHEIAVASETGAFEKGIKTGVVKPLEDAEKALKKLGDTDAGRDIDRDLDAAQRATKRLKDETKDAADAIEREFRDAYRKMRSNADDAADAGSKSMGRIRDGAQEVQQEFGQNMAESVSSFRGDISDLGQVGQDTLGGLAGTVAGMGPAGLAGAFALAAGATGLGLLTAGQDAAKEKQDAINESAAKFAEAYIDGIDGAISAASVFAEINSIATDPERYKKAGENAKNWGVDVQMAMRAMSGDENAIGAVEVALRRQKEAMDANAEGADNMAQNIEAATTGQSSANSSYLAGKQALDELNNALDLGAQQARNSQEAQYEYAQSVGVATGKTDDLGNAIVRLPDGKEVVMNAQTKQANTDVDAFDSKVQSVRDKTVYVRANLDSLDSSIRSYRPPVLQLRGEVAVPRGSVTLY